MCPSPLADQKRRDREEAAQADELARRQKVAADRARQVARQVQANAALAEKVERVAEVNEHYAVSRRGLLVCWCASASEWLTVCALR